MVFRVTMVDHMCFCSCGLRQFGNAVTTSSYFEIRKAEEHVVYHGEPEPHCVDGDHVGVNIHGAVQVLGKVGPVVVF